MMRNCPELVGEPVPVARDRVAFGVVCLGLALGRFGFIASAQAQSHDPIVTSDSPEYCGVLMDRISGLTRAATMPPPSEASELSEEGERMCMQGQTRGGILRLRRALAILRHGED